MRAWLEEQISIAAEDLQRCERGLAELDRRRAELLASRAAAQARVDTLEQTLRHALTDEQRSGKRKQRSPSLPGSRKSRALSETWKDVFRFMASRSDPVSNDDMMNYIGQHYPDVSRDNLRSQLSLYHGKDYVKRISPGVYELTPEGAKMAGVELTKRGSTNDQVEPQDTSMGTAGSRERAVNSAPVGSTPTVSTSSMTTAPWDLDDDEIPF